MTTLFDPIKLGDIELSNRLVVPPAHGSHVADPDQVSDKTVIQCGPPSGAATRSQG